MAPLRLENSQHLGRRAFQLHAVADLEHSTLLRHQHAGQRVHVRRLQIQVEPAVDKLIAAMQDSTNSYQLNALGEALAKLPITLTPAQAEPTVARLVAFIQDEDGIDQLKALGRALAALASKLTPAQTESAVGRLVAAMQDSTKSSQLKALGEALVALPFELIPEVVEAQV